MQYQYREVRLVNEVHHYAVYMSASQSSYVMNCVLQLISMRNEAAAAFDLTGYRKGIGLAECKSSFEQNKYLLLAGDPALLGQSDASDITT